LSFHISVAEKSRSINPHNREDPRLLGTAVEETQVLLLDIAQSFRSKVEDPLDSLAHRKSYCESFVI